MSRIIFSDLKDNVMSKPKRTKVFVVGGATGYANWLPNIEIVNSKEECDVVFFTGGEDVSPSLYGEMKHSKTYCNPTRDKREVEIGQWAIKNKKKIIGVCRGAQLSCVLAGGKLVQHQDNRDFIHPIQTLTGENLMITSTHHQAMYPFSSLRGKDYILMGWTENQSRFHFDGNNNELAPKREAEICWFGNINALGIQGHPEMLWREKEDYIPTFTFLQRLFSLMVQDKLEETFR